jgi:hypothetical protein
VRWNAVTYKVTITEMRRARGVLRAERREVRALRCACVNAL